MAPGSYKSLTDADLMMLEAETARSRRDPAIQSVPLKKKKQKLNPYLKTAVNYVQDQLEVNEDMPYLGDIADVAVSETGTSGFGAATGAAVGGYMAGPTGVPFGATVGNYLEKSFVNPEDVSDFVTKLPTLTKEIVTEDFPKAIDNLFYKQSFFKFLKNEIASIPKNLAIITGMGDYTLESNSLVKGGGAVAQGAKIIPQGNRSVRIIYKEYIGDVFTHPTVAGGFNLASYPLNPGLVQTFPWLATIAQQYEQWTPNGIAFEFKSTSSEYVSTQALGSVIMSTEYDVYDEPFENKQEMLNSCYSNEAKPSQHIIHGVECDARDNPLSIFYVRTAANNSTGSSLRETDLGVFYIATQGGATANLNLGSLYIVYDITLRKEQMFNGVRNKGLILDCIYGIVGVASATPLPVRSTNSTSTYSTEIMTIGGLGTTIRLPSWINGGIWRVMYHVSFTAEGNRTAPSFSPTSGCSLAGTDPRSSMVEDSSSTAYVTSWQDFEISSNVGVGALITASGATLGATVSSCFLMIFQIGNGFE